MIVLDKAQVTDLYIPKTKSCGCGLKKGVFGKKDIEAILADYVEKEVFLSEIARLEQMIEDLQ